MTERLPRRPPMTAEEKAALADVQVLKKRGAPATCGHPDRKIQGRGMCHACYERWRRNTTPEERKQRDFWDYVDKSAGEDGCWVWQGVNSRGYGVWFIAGVRTLAHRYSKRLVEPEPFEGAVACHRCDNPPCVNPAHLFWGTRADNNADRIAKGRSVYVPTQTHCKLGHLIDGDNLRIVRTKTRERRLCRTCNNEYAKQFARRRAAAKRAAAAAIETSAAEAEGLLFI